MLLIHRFLYVNDIELFREIRCLSGCANPKKYGHSTEMWGSCKRLVLNQSGNVVSKDSRKESVASYHTESIRNTLRVCSRYEILMRYLTGSHILMNIQCK